MINLEYDDCYLINRYLKLIKEVAKIGLKTKYAQNRFRPCAYSNFN